MFLFAADLLRLTCHIYTTSAALHFGREWHQWQLLSLYRVNVKFVNRINNAKDVTFLTKTSKNTPPVNNSQQIQKMVCTIASIYSHTIETNSLLGIVNNGITLSTIPDVPRSVTFTNIEDYRARCK